MNRPERPRALLLWLLALVPVLGHGQPVCTVDAVWRHESGAPVLEVDVMVQRGSLAWQAVEGGAEAGWQAQAWLERNGAVVADTSWTRMDRRPLDPPPAPGEKLPDQVLLPLDGRGGRLRLRVTDLIDGQSTEKSLRLSPPGQGELGGIFLGVAAPMVATDGPFLHGTGTDRWRFLPYGDAIYGSGLDTLHAVAELRVEDPLDSLELSVALLNERGRRLESALPRSLSTFSNLQGPVSLVALKQAVGHLPSGSYSLEVRLSRPDGQVTSAVRAFWIHNPGVAPAQMVDEATLALDEAGPEELARQWEAAQVLAGHHEMEAWERLDLEGRRAFLKEFWRQRDPDPATLVNEGQTALLARVEEARRRWPQAGPGESLGDRARIFVRFGPPDAIETDFGQLNARYDFQLGGNTSTGREHRDFELWLYNRVDGGVEFIFIDVQGFGTFELVHSTKSGEFFDPQWARKLFP
jgi:GWxTD domain-containing protein